MQCPFRGRDDFAGDAPDAAADTCAEDYAGGRAVKRSGNMARRAESVDPSTAAGDCMSRVDAVSPVDAVDVSRLRSVTVALYLWAPAGRGPVQITLVADPVWPYAADARPLEGGDHDDLPRIGPAGLEGPGGTALFHGANTWSWRISAAAEVSLACRKSAEAGTTKPAFTRDLR